MKALFPLMLVALTAFVSDQVSAQAAKQEKIVEVKPSVVNATRGKNPGCGFLRPRNSAKKYLRCPVFGKKRGPTATCVIQFYNQYDKDVDMYVDEVYVGSVKANDKGIIESIKKYAGIYANSDDNKLAWKESGDCGSNFVFKLNKE